MGDYIQVHCSKCNRAIRAPRAAAGRWGKCPSCHNKLYVPTPDDELEEIPLAPLDDEDERQEQEARRVAAELLRQRTEAPEPSGASQGAAPAKAAAANAAKIQVTELIIAYLMAMKRSDLDEARSHVDQLRRVKSQARSRVQQLMVDAMPPPKLGDIPQGLYLGFLKKLDGELG